MIFFRTETQAAFNTLLVAARETLDHYRDAAELVEGNLQQLFGDINGQRQVFIQRLEDAVRALGDLPAAPDPDKEGAEMLFHHVAALLKTHYAGDILAQRIKGEQQLAERVNEALSTELENANKRLLEDMAQHITQTTDRLQVALGALSTEDIE